MHAYQGQVGVLVPAQERRVQDVPMFIEQRVAVQLRATFPRECSPDYSPTAIFFPRQGMMDSFTFP
jgi:hypothetical protein